MDDDFDLLAMLNGPTVEATEEIVTIEGNIEEVLEVLDSPHFERSVEEISKSEVLRQITNILGEYELESNIPITHEYWRLINKYRVM